MDVVLREAFGQTLNFPANQASLLPYAREFAAQAVENECGSGAVSANYAAALRRGQFDSAAEVHAAMLGLRLGLALVPLAGDFASARAILNAGDPA